MGIVRPTHQRTLAGAAAFPRGALESVESEHLRPLEPAVKAINAQFDTIVGAFPDIARKAKLVADRRSR